MTDQTNAQPNKPTLGTRIKESIQRDPLHPTDDRGRMKMVMNNLILHIHPARVSKPALRFNYTFGLGGLLIQLHLGVLQKG